MILLVLAQSSGYITLKSINLVCNIPWLLWNLFAISVFLGHFCQFDHGPDYDISKISSPVAIYHSHGDILATTQVYDLVI